MKMIFLMMAFMSDAEAKKRKKGEGVKVSITVVDHDTNKPVATAKIQHPKEEMPHRVNEVNGMWQDTEILLPDGMLPFTPGSSLEFEVSAPGYITQHIQYDVRRWKNNLSIKLQKMDISTTGIQIPIVPMDVDEERDPVMGGGGN